MSEKRSFASVQPCAKYPGVNLEGLHRSERENQPPCHSVLLLFSARPRVPVAVRRPMFTELHVGALAIQLRPGPCLCEHSALQVSRECALTGFAFLVCRRPRQVKSDHGRCQPRNGVFENSPQTLSSEPESPQPQDAKLSNWQSQTTTKMWSVRWLGRPR